MGRKPRGVIKALKPEVFTGVYAEIAAEIDSETAMKIFELFRGQAVIFPQKLFDRRYVRAFIRQHRREYSVRELARMFGYSQTRGRFFCLDSAK